MFGWLRKSIFFLRRNLVFEYQSDMGNGCVSRRQEQDVSPAVIQELSKERSVGTDVLSPDTKKKSIKLQLNVNEPVHPIEEELVMEYFPPNISPSLSSWTLQSLPGHSTRSFGATGEYSPPAMPIVLDHLLPRAKILIDNPKARTLFYRYVKDGTWIESLFSRRQEQYVNFSPKQKKQGSNTRNSFFREISSIRLHQYIVPSPKSGARRTLSEEEEIASSMMMLIKKLKVKDLSSNDLFSDKFTLANYLSPSTQKSAMFASALALFLRSPEFRKAESNHWNDDVQHLKLHTGSFYHRSSKGKKDDPFLHIKQIFSSLIVGLNEKETDQLLSTTDWVLELHNSLEKLPYSMVISDMRNPEHHYFPIGYVNPAFTALTGYSMEEVVGKNCKFLQCEKTEPKQANIISEALRRCEACKVGLTNRTKDGRSFINFLSLRPVLDRNRGVCNFVLGIPYDIDSEHSQVLDLQMIDNILLIYSQVLC